MEKFLEKMVIRRAVLVADTSAINVTCRWLLVMDYGDIRGIRFVRKWKKKYRKVWLKKILRS